MFVAITLANKNLLLAALLLACSFAAEFGTTFAFQTPKMRVHVHTNRFFETQQIKVNNKNTPYYPFDFNKMTILTAENNDNDNSNSNDVNNVNERNNFDGEGFAKYLLPYAAALIGSILATAAVFKFVLLDY
mmetsp:Transcript_21397/g.44012  ORF Transcript_21397/g.44012 Transcript_21397/m.44012 type:complete len:132 (-) Transcript_21397:140-535(-)